MSDERRDTRPAQQTTPRPNWAQLPISVLRKEAATALRVDATLALTVLKAALRQAPDDRDVLWDKAKIEYGVGDLGATHSTLTRLLGRGSDLEAMDLLVKVLRRLGRSDQASVVYLQAQALKACQSDSDTVAGTGLGPME